jgi:hypothetical protein
LARRERAGRLKTLRQDPSQQARLPGFYDRACTGPLDLIAIDTSIDRRIDAAQGDCGS